MNKSLQNNTRFSLHWRYRIPSCLWVPAQVILSVWIFFLSTSPYPITLLMYSIPTHLHQINIRTSATPIIYQNCFCFLFIALVMVHVDMSAWLTAIPPTKLQVPRNQRSYLFCPQLYSQVPEKVPKMWLSLNKFWKETEEWNKDLSVTSVEQSALITPLPQRICSYPRTLLAICLSWPQS